MQAELFFKNEPDRKFNLSHGDLILGRSKDCDIVIADPYVSRRQISISLTDGRAILKNIGSNPLLIAGNRVEPGQETLLEDNNEIHAGRSVLVFRLKPEEQPAPEDYKSVIDEEKTVVLSSPVTDHGPKLVITDPSGRTSTQPLKDTRLSIGRAEDAGLRLQDKTVSRHHALIEKKADGFYLKTLSTTNPVVVNKHKISEKRLFNGDLANIGTFTLLFLSDSPSDARRNTPKTAGFSAPGDRRLYAMAGGALLLLSLFFYIFYARIYSPWMFSRHLNEAARYIESGNPEHAVVMIEEMLQDNISPEQEDQASKILADAVLLGAREVAAHGDVEGARKSLVRFLKLHGGETYTKPLWNLLDLYRIEHARKLEKEGLFLNALKEYAAIEDDSPYFDTAQQESGRILLEYQKERLKQQTISQIIQEAEAAFQEKHYITPVNHNAYAAYQAVLSIDPSNQLARDRIEEIKAILKDRGKAAYGRKRYSEALAAFERYLFISPDDREVKKLTRICRQRLSPKRVKKKSVDRHRERVKKLLKDTGAESPWVMKYLFEEDKKKRKDTPW